LLALVAIVIRALPSMFGESDAKRPPTFPLVYEAPHLPLIICIDRRPFLPCPAGGAPTTFSTGLFDVRRHV
jgi:hypothetical protein